MKQDINDTNAMWREHKRLARQRSNDREERNIAALYAAAKADPKLRVQKISQYHYTVSYDGNEEYGLSYWPRTGSARRRQVTAGGGTIYLNATQVVAMAKGMVEWTR